MGFFWPNSPSEDSGAVRRLYQMRRRVYLGSVLLVSLVSFEAVICGTVIDVPLWFRIFNYTLCGYAVCLLVYTTWWLWKSWSVSKKRRLLSMVDPLTGLMNWQGLVEVIRGQSANEGGPVQLVYVDLMGLEKVNAVHGQTTGDGVLAEAFCRSKDQAPFLERWEEVGDPVDPLLSVTEGVLDGVDEDRPNDGLVRVSDAKWGEFWGCVPADHLDEVGQLLGDDPGGDNDWDHVAFYRRLVDYLHHRGY